MMAVCVDRLCIGGSFEIPVVRKKGIYLAAERRRVWKLSFLNTFLSRLLMRGQLEVGTCGNVLVLYV